MDPYEVHLFKFAVLNQKGTIAPPAYNSGWSQLHDSIS